MGLAQDNDVVHTFTPDRANQPFEKANAASHSDEVFGTHRPPRGAQRCDDRERVMMRWGMPPPAAHGRPASHRHPQYFLAALARVADVEQS
jgi:hypothetical protein